MYCGCGGPVQVADLKTATVVREISEPMPAAQQKATTSTNAKDSTKTVSQANRIAHILTLTNLTLSVVASMSA